MAPPPVTFTDYVPLPREDGIAWTIIKIKESAASTGPWVLIDTINIADPDLLPANPKARSFTTHNATLDAGWYQVIFQDVNGAQVVSDPIHNIPPAEEPWYPSVRDVALKILSRTKNTYGSTLGTFTADTTPTAADVMQIIRQAAMDVADVIGDDVPEALRDDAANVVALKAAMQVELAYFSDQVNTGRSIYPQLERMYQGADGKGGELARVARAIELFAEGESGLTDTGPTNKASWNFDAQYKELRW